MIPIQYIITENRKWDTISHVKAALKAGCKWIQWQPNTAIDKKVIKTAQKIKGLCRDVDATFIIENNVELVKTIDGDGIQITNDLSVAEARQKLGEGFLIGATAHHAEDIIKMKKQSADYIICGPYSSIIDNQPEMVLSLSDYQNIINKLEEESIYTPICAYGDISPKDIRPILETGIRGFSLHLSEENLDEEKVIQNLDLYLNI